MSLAQEYIGCFSPKTKEERRLFGQLLKKLMDVPESLELVRHAFIFRKLTIEGLVTAFDSAMAQTAQIPSTEMDSNNLLIACTHLLFPFIPADQQKVLRSLCVLSGYFDRATATRILMPDYEYDYEYGVIEWPPSPIDRIIAELIGCGLLGESILRTGSDTGLLLVQVPGAVRRYLDWSCPGLEADKDLLKNFAVTQFALARGLVEDIEIDAVQRHYARATFKDLRCALRHLSYTQKAEHAYRCARIADALGDDDLAAELREIEAVTENVKDEFQDLVSYIESAHISQYIKPIFPSSSYPQTPQEELDQILLTAAEHFVDLGILRRLSFSSYEFTLSFPEFVRQLSLTPYFAPSIHLTKLDAAIETGKTAIKRVRQHGFIPEMALLSFALGRALAMKSLWIQANTQFNNAIQFAKEMNDQRLESAAFLELAAIGIYRGYAQQTHTRNLFMWARSGFRQCGDFSNCASAVVAEDVFLSLMGIHTDQNPSHALTFLEASGLSRNSFNQTADDINSLYNRLTC